jgi:hypothetical protein
LTVLRSFDAPSAACWKTEAFRERGHSAALRGAAGLLGIDADPLRSREHILLANLLGRAWRDGRISTVADLIRAIQSPPFDRVGVPRPRDVLPAKDRFGLAMRSTTCSPRPASPAGWKASRSTSAAAVHGPRQAAVVDPLDRPPVRRRADVLRHDPAQRGVAWMRTQPGTSSLRAILYMDEVFGYFPPTANPPSKRRC